MVVPLVQRRTAGEVLMTDPSLFDELGARQCVRCGLFKPLPEFSASLRATGSVKVGSYCRRCRTAYQQEWYLKNREKCVAAAAARRAAEKANSPPPVERRPLREAIGFRKFANPRKQGNAGLGIAIAYLSRIGVDVAIPLTDTQRYDLLMVHDAGMERVQVKTTTMRDPRYGHYRVSVQCIGRNNTGTVRRKFDQADYEWLFVVCGDACCYMIPSNAITARTVFYLTRRYDPYMLTNDESG
jgi:PD-(D/E)XK nuclease superfamily protein